jgi:RHS repeat-associated protein
MYHPAEYNTYALGGAPITWRTDSAGNWRKEYKLFDHLGSVRTVLRKDASITGYEYREQISYKPFGEVKDRLYCTGSTDADARLKYIGKQMDFEMGLADHGVRKYDNSLGMFTSIDPLWEK